MGDFNLTPDSAFIHELQADFSMADVIQEKMSPEQAQRSTYKWVPNHLDHLMDSWEVLESITNLEYGT